MAASSTTSPLPKIVGGRPAPKDAYPWMTALILRGQTPVKGQFCGGALIHPQWVLSAAHCVEDMSASSLDVLVGGYDLRSSSDGTWVSVSQIVIHPRFSTVKGALVNDVALLKLSQPLTGVPVLSLVDAVSQVAPGTPVKGMGWGTTSEGGRQSPILLEVDMNLVSLTEASEVYPGLSEVHLAAGVPGGGRDTCQGDSGGPLVVSDGRDDHGNTAAKATAVAWNAPTRGILETTTDQDWFRLEASGPGTVNLSSSGTNDVQGTLVNTSGKILAQDNNGAGASNFLILTNVAAGTYYLKVTGTGSSKGAYTVLAKWTAAPVVTGAPEIGLLGLDSTPITDGALIAKTTDGTDFGEVDLSNGSRSTSFSVRNTGKATLTLGAVRLSGSGAAQFRVTTQVPSTVAAGRSAAFQITYDPTTVGRHQASVSLSNNDADESPYDFVIVGFGTSPTDDVGNTPATATRVAVPSTTPARLDVAQDQATSAFAANCWRGLTTSWFEAPPAPRRAPTDSRSPSHSECHTDR